MKRILALILILGIIMGGVGCIQKEGNAIILSFGNETYTFTLPENLTNTTTQTQTPTTYTYEKRVEAGKILVIEDPRIEIKVDYEINKGKFVFFVTYNNQTNHYYEPMDIEIQGIKIHGEGYWVGTSLYIATIKIESPRELSFSVKEVSQ
ncbi:hypothetical protein [Pyrococcus kukulkanii]|uniref:Uncharacterized protein n=1 Tax=Pyrococcus kukulkanii TaxID=1609559 RepID=A0A127B8I4_9EURY|nr:hypothetical protein [Pyrococcus kukulkanii]AMM53487.1 hypothetical protein TQ32_02530 [Pyrococcus kukulkanii]